VVTSLTVGIVVLYVPFFQDVFIFVSLSLSEFGILFILSSAVFLIGEGYKFLKRKNSSSRVK